AYQQGDYETAISEFARFMHFYPRDERFPEALFTTGMSYFNQERFGKAVDVFDRVISRFGHTDYAVESAFMAAQCDMRLNDDDAALHRLNALTHERFDPDVQDRAFYQMGWLFLERRDPASAGRAFDAVSEASRGIFGTDDLMDRLKDLERLPTKSPMAAGILSIMPGGGYLYTNRIQDAFISFVFIAAGAGAAWESFDNDLNVIGSIAAIVTLGFYSGSVYGSINAAHKYNARAYDNFIYDLKQNRPAPAPSRMSLYFSPRTDGAGLLLTFSL
ncbi:MAG: tetratricopeptide repeat protein, partial [Thermodesulfobacteriota bacterium]